MARSKAHRVTRTEGASGLEVVAKGRPLAARGGSIAK